jgi:hypothetical protein
MCPVIPLSHFKMRAMQRTNGLEIAHTHVLKLSGGGERLVFRR